MAKLRISLLRKGLYWSLALAVAALVAPSAWAQKKAKPTPKAVAVGAEHDPLTEWELLNGAAIELRARIAKQPRDDALRQQMADLAIRSAVGAERALAIGDASLFESYRRQFSEQFQDTPWRIGRMASQGIGAASYAAGVLAVHGFLKPADVEASCRDFATALAKGYVGAKFRASQCLDKTDPDRAAILLQEAAVSGHPVAAEIAGRVCLAKEPQDFQCAWDRLTFAAAAGRPSAQSLLGWMYARGIGGKGADPTRAIRLYQQAAKAGDAAAQNNIAELYETGRGVPTDLKQAVDWYRKAADAGFASAQFNLGRLYAAGTGVPKDYPQARKLLEQAELGGVAAARTLLEWMEKNPAM